MTAKIEFNLSGALSRDDLQELVNQSGGTEEGVNKTVAEAVRDWLERQRKALAQPPSEVAVPA